MHHNDVRARIHLLVGPLPQPAVRRQPLLQAFGKNCRKRTVPKHVIVLIDDHRVCVLTGVANALQDSPRILRMWRIRRGARQIVRCLVLLVASLHAKLIHAGPVVRGVSARDDQAGRARHERNCAFRSV